MKLMLLLLLVLVCLGLFETARHAYFRRRIPIRIHVNGSRGKSSVTRLIAAGLRAGGIRTLAKTTGSAACFIHTDGSESPVWRRGGPNIREQLRVFRAAAAEGVQALVLECMAIRPDLQWVCEHRIVDSTLGVITNVRPDHLEIMGPSLAEAAASLAGTVPRRGHLLTAEVDFADLLGERARRLGSQFTLTDPGAISMAELAGFSYVEFPENVSLALAVCQAAGIDREKALTGMRSVQPDVGALTRQRFREGDRVVEFVNAFAANDAVSTVRIWEHLGLQHRPEQTQLLMNVRGDRAWRSKDLAPLFGRELTAGHYILIGEETGLIADILRRQGLAGERIIDLGGETAQRIWERICTLDRGDTTVVGIGNIAGIGRALLAYLATKEQEG